MPRAGRRINGDIPIALVGVAVFVAYIWVLTKATEPVVTILSFASSGEPKVYAALLAVLTALPGCLLTLPRAFAGAPPPVRPSVLQRRQLSARRRSFMPTDLLGLATLLFAQVPLPAPWGPAGKAATIANITRSAEIVDLSARFGKYSLGIFAVGALTALLVKVYGHAAAWRVIGIILAIGVPVLAWFWLTRSL
jgi:hypothetical protein